MPEMSLEEAQAFATEQLRDHMTFEDATLTSQPNEDTSAYTFSVDGTRYLVTVDDSQVVFVDPSKNRTTILAHHADDVDETDA